MAIPQDETTRADLRKEEQKRLLQSAAAVAKDDEKDVAEMMAELPGLEL